MPAKNIYVKDSDLPFWEQAQTLGVSISSLVSDCLRQKLQEQHEGPPVQKMEKLAVTLWSGGDCGREPDFFIRKTFTGRWLVPPPSWAGEHKSPLASLLGESAQEQVSSGERRSKDFEDRWAVAETERGAIVTYGWDGHCEFSPWFEVFENFQKLVEAASDPERWHIPDQETIAKAAWALKIPYEIHLDI